MKVRACDSNWNWIFGKGKQNYAKESMAIAFDLKMKIQSWKRDCYFAQDDYIDWEFLLSNKNTREDIENNLYAITVAHEGVMAVSSIDVSADEEKRKFTANINYIDVYGYERMVTTNG